ncbi:MAG: ABC transporter permease [Gammaproteobacteria bacterium]|nr:ABC transporter permease [Gammaproteobacteria bacterium]
MLTSDFVRLTLGSLVSHRMRSSLTATGIAIGIAAVVLLTSIGEGLHQYVISEFSQFGTNIISVQPGTTQTHGGNVAALSNIRPLSLEDAEALKRLPGIIAANGVVQGNAEIEGNFRQRRTMVQGVGPQSPQVFEFFPAKGKFLPDDDITSPRPYAVLGSKLKDELFGDLNALGQPIRIGGHRYRVIGVMESKGQILGFDLDDTIYVPTARAMELFNQQSLMEIQVKYRESVPTGEVVAGIKRLLLARHGHKDFTIITQEQMLETLNDVLNVLTFAVGALGGISLFVGGIGVLTIMSIAVNERVSEIGLLRALGSPRKQILFIFLGEAILLSALGGAAGLFFGAGIAQLLAYAIPSLPVYTPWSFAFGAEAIAVAIGLLAGVLPAQRAARMDPIDALRTE